MKKSEWSWPIFEYLTAKAYHELEQEGCGTLLTLEEVTWVFRCYLRLYQTERKKQHPRLTYHNIKQLIAKMDDFDADDYPALIGQYFSTRFKGCDYNINHFFSGDIRQIRACECGLAKAYGLYEK